jgi:hypothetical protein
MMTLALGNLPEVGQVGVQRAQPVRRGGAVAGGARRFRFLGGQSLGPGPEALDPLASERGVHPVHDQALDGDVTLGEALGKERRLLDGVAPRGADDNEAARRLAE